VCSLQIFEAGECPVEILRQVKDLLRHLDYFFFLGAGNQNQFLNDLVSDQSIPLELLANLKCNVERADANK